MKDSVKKELARIARFLEKKPQEEAQELWWVLSALRGPDKEFDTSAGIIVEDAAKAAATEPIRFAALGTAACQRVGAFSGKDSPDKQKLRVVLNDPQEHFVHHAQWAFQVLGIEW